MKDGAAKLMQRDRFAQRPFANCNRIDIDHRASFKFILRQQPVCDKQHEQMLAALDETVAPPARPSGVTALFCERFAGPTF